ncbi:MAG: polysaccharide deacetylase family protein [bacterium]|nr:polysaccharide deacetylase family protein [bacterium]
MFATIQVDLDGIWTIFKYHRIEVAHYPDIVFSQSIFRFLELFHSYNIHATFFVVGSDLENPEVANQVKRLVDAGHEIANHSYSHPLNFSLLSTADKRNEILNADRILRKITGKIVRGFRSPAYAIDTETLMVLTELGYQYDSSILPTHWSWLIRWVESGMALLHFSPSASYGKIKYARAPQTIYHPDLNRFWKKGNSSLWEVPVSVYPYIRTPIHSSFASRIGWRYFASAVNQISRLGLPLIYVFHGVDLVDDFVDDRIPKIKWVCKPLKVRLILFHQMLEYISTRYQIVSTKELIENQSAIRNFTSEHP